MRRIPCRSSPLRTMTRPAASEYCPDADPGFPGRQPMIWSTFREICLKMKKSEPGRSAHGEGGWDVKGCVSQSLNIGTFDFNYTSGEIN